MARDDDSTSSSASSYTSDNYSAPSSESDSGSSPRSSVSASSSSSSSASKLSKTTGSSAGRQRVGTPQKTKVPPGPPADPDASSDSSSDGEYDDEGAMQRPSPAATPVVDAPTKAEEEKAAASTEAEATAEAPPAPEEESGGDEAHKQEEVETKPAQETKDQGPPPGTPEAERAEPSEADAVPEPTQPAEPPTAQDDSGDVEAAAGVDKQDDGTQGEDEARGGEPAGERGDNLREAPAAEDGGAEGEPAAEPSTAGDTGDPPGDESEGKEEQAEAPTESQDVEQPEAPAQASDPAAEQAEEPAAAPAAAPCDQESVENSPEQESVENSPEQESVENSPEQESVENSPEQESAENSPEQESAENSPEQAAGSEAAPVKEEAEGSPGPVPPCRQSPERDRDVSRESKRRRERVMNAATTGVAATDETELCSRYGIASEDQVPPPELGGSAQLRRPRVKPASSGKASRSDEQGLLAMYNPVAESVYQRLYPAMFSATHKELKRVVGKQSPRLKHHNRDATVWRRPTPPAQLPPPMPRGYPRTPPRSAAALTHLPLTQCAGSKKKSPFQRDNTWQIEPAPPEKQKGVTCVPVPPPPARAEPHPPAHITGASQAGMQVAIAPFRRRVHREHQKQRKGRRKRKLDAKSGALVPVGDRLPDIMVLKEDALRLRCLKLQSKNSELQQRVIELQQRNVRTA